MRAITSILHRHGCINDEESAKHRAYGSFERIDPNDLWQVDFKGEFALIGGALCYPLTMSEFDRWRDVYNQKRPHDTLDLGVPLSRYRVSDRSFEEQTVAYEYSDRFEVRKVNRVFVFVMSHIASAKRSAVANLPTPNMKLVQTEAIDALHSKRL